MIFVKGILYQRQSTTFLLFCLKVYLNREAPNFVEKMSVATKYLKAVLQWHFPWRLSKTIEFHVPAIWQAVYSSSLFVLPMGVIKQVIHDFGGWGRVFKLHSLRVSPKGSTMVGFTSSKKSLWIEGNAKLYLGLF
ncbi:hypothetical protein F2P56_004348 [Juglans regia]|uniref:Uncharacterized protein n=1 Tax=Juglans regia TaxID=51240 RepID=A0A833XUP1_JUGRE|nr:hypothetical protein F2P56_004348 [Juglans regia]